MSRRSSSDGYRDSLAGVMDMDISKGGVEHGSYEKVCSKCGVPFISSFDCEKAVCENCVVVRKR